MEKLCKRDSRLDLIRIFSLFCVAGIHFFLNSGFYSQMVPGKRMFIMCIFRSFFIICVPMFITLTGYLMNKKTISKKYYKGLFKTLIIYLICSVIYFIFSKLYLHEEISIIMFIKNLLSFDGTRYSWYIEMYIGLFLLIPFFNIIFNNLNSQKETKILLFTLMILLGVPSIMNIFKISINWWESIYPIFYYFLGAYLSKYKINLSRFCNILFLIITLILDGLLNFYISNGVEYTWGTWNTYSSLLIMISTFLVFNLLLNIKINDNKTKSFILKTLSDACLGAYLISCIFDNIYYDKLANIIPIVKDRFIYAPILIILVFISSLLSSILINIFYNLIKFLCKKIKHKLIS